MLTRRRFAAASAATLLTAAARHRCRPPLLERAIERLGGHDRLSGVRALHWTGTATVHAGGRDIEIGVRTRVVPFGAARSDSWLQSEGPAKTRSLILDADGRGWIERGGQREPMTAAMAAHEREQYAVYGLMLLAPLCGHARATTRNQLTINRPPAPPTQLAFDGNARLVGARNTVVAAEGGTRVSQSFGFGGWRDDWPIAWPSTIAIRQNDAPYFDLTLHSFAID